MPPLTPPQAETRSKFSAGSSTRLRRASRAVEMGDVPDFTLDMVVRPLEVKPPEDDRRNGPDDQADQPPARRDIDNLTTAEDCGVSTRGRLFRGYDPEGPGRIFE